MSVPGLAEKMLGGGAILHNDVPFLLTALKLDNTVVELSWGIAQQSISQLNTKLALSTSIYSALVKLHFPLDLDVTPFIGIGGISAVMKLSGSFKTVEISLRIPEKGVQAVAGVEYATSKYPVAVFVALNYSTITHIPLTFEIDGKLETLEVPFKGISGFGWNVGFRYDFFGFGAL